MSLPGPTLCLDIGGSGIKSLLLNGRGEPKQDQQRVALPRPSTPHSVTEAIVAVTAGYKHYERVSVGMPGVVVDEVIVSCPSLGSQWKDIPLGRELKVKLECLVKVANDADVRGLGVVEGQGVELVLTLGTGMGSSLFVDGRLVPNFQLGHHPFRKKSTYEEYVGQIALKGVGVKRWSKRVLRVLDQIRPVLNPRVIYLGGMNAKRLKTDLPKYVKIVPELSGLLGGFRLWD